MMAATSPAFTVEVQAADDFGAVFGDAGVQVLYFRHVMILSKE